jgi:hypothetical protein
MASMISDLALALDPALIMTRAGTPPDPWQAQLLRSEAKRTLLLCSRQSGKSTVTGALALWEAIYRPPALILLLSPSLRQSQELYRKVRDFYQTLAGQAPAETESALRLELQNGSRIISLPGQESTIRGYSGVSLLVIDEAARVEDPLYYSVRPMLAVSGGRMVCLSTPFGKRGFFHEEWQNGGTSWERTKITAAQCPRISPIFLEEERAALGDWWFRQEYGCEFVETVDNLFTYDDVAAMFVSRPTLFGG